MGDVTQLFPQQSISKALRDVADMYDNGELPAEHCTIVIGREVIHLGSHDDRKATKDAIFDLAFGTHKVMAPVVDMSYGDKTEGER